MPEFRKGGVKAVHHSSNGTTGNWTAIAGDVTRAEGLPPTSIDQEHTSGNYQSGENSTPTFYFVDHDDYSTLKALNRTRTFFAIEFFDGTILKTKIAVYPKANLAPKPTRGEGDSEWSLSWNHDSDETFEKIASLT